MIWYLLLYALCCIAIFLLVKTNFSEIKTWQKFLMVLFSPLVSVFIGLALVAVASRFPGTAAGRGGHEKSREEDSFRLGGR